MRAGENWQKAEEEGEADRRQAGGQRAGRTAATQVKSKSNSTPTRIVVVSVGVGVGVNVSSLVASLPACLLPACCRHAACPLLALPAACCLLPAIAVAVVAVVIIWTRRDLRLSRLMRVDWTWT